MANQLEIDVIYTGSQKTLGVPPGTSPISFSPKAVAAFKARTKPPCSFYLDLGWLGEYWNCWPDKGRIYHHTGPVNAMYGLREGLAMVAEEGLENVWRRHRAWPWWLRRAWRTCGGGTGSVLIICRLECVSWGLICSCLIPRQGCPP